MHPRAIRVAAVRHAFEDFRYRLPIKFGGVALDRVTLLNVNLSVRTADGRVTPGFGSMPLGNVWSFPSRVLTYDQTLAAMKALAGRVEKLYAACTEAGHPIDVTWALEHAVFRAADEVTRDLALAEPIPRLCALVVASAVDAALHDAYGKAFGFSSYHTYGPDFLPHDLGHYLGPEFTGDHVSSHVSREPKPTMPLYHLVGALDPLTDPDVKERPAD